jgi:zinc transport system permease protein
MPEILTHPFMRDALLAGVALSFALSLVGFFLVMNRMVFMGAALTQVATLGMATGLVLNLSPLGLGLAAALLGSAALGRQRENGPLPADSLLAVAFVGGSALSLLALSQMAQGLEELNHLLFGTLLAVSGGYLLGLVLLAVAVLAAGWLVFKETLYITFDPAMARAQGFRVRLWQHGLYGVSGLVIAVCVKGAGFLLVFSLLVIPTNVGLVLGSRIRSVLAVAFATALASSVAGLVSSFYLDLPPGASIVTVLLALLGISYLVRWVARR